MLERERLDVAVGVHAAAAPPRAGRRPRSPRGIHVYLEKPIARTPEDAEAIVAAAARSEPRSAPSATSGTRASCWRPRVTRLRGSGWPCWWAATSARWPAGRGSSTRRRAAARSWSGAATTSISSGRSRARSRRSRRSQAACRSPRTEGGSSIDDTIVLLLHFRDGGLGTVHSVWSRDDQPELYATDVARRRVHPRARARPRAVPASAGARAARRSRPCTAIRWRGRSPGSWKSPGAATTSAGVFCAPDDAIAHARRGARLRAGARDRAGGWSCELKRIDHVGIVVADLDAHVAQLGGAGPLAGPHQHERREPRRATSPAATPASS